MHMATIHISAAEAARDFTTLLAHVRAGAEVIIEDGSLTVAVLHTPGPEAVATRREPLNPPAWD
jgi:antitoxin (DNA-binding transcriptional repressor) of toxin-antitoxin stability system